MREELVAESITKDACWKPWVVCIVASFFFFYEFIQGNMFASIADNIMHDFHLQADTMTYLSSVYYVSNVLFLFVSGQLLDRFSPKKIITAAMLLCVVSTFVLSHAHSFYMALFCRFMTGIGSAFCFLGPIRIASSWFLPKRMAFVTGIVVTMAMTGGMLAQYPLTKLVVMVGWRNALFDVGILGLCMWACMLLLVKDSPHPTVKESVPPMSILTSAKLAYCNTQTLCAALFTSLMNMGVAVFGAIMGSLYLIQRLGIGKEDAAMVNSMLFLGAIVGGPLMGYWSDKIGLRLLPMKAGVGLSLLTVFAILYLPVSINGMAILFFLLGLFTAAQVISYAFVAESSPQNMTATALSLVSILTQGGYIIYQNIFSRILVSHGEMHMEHGLPIYSLGDYQMAAMILPVGLILAWLAVLNLKETYCRR